MSLELVLKALPYIALFVSLLVVTILGIHLFYLRRSEYDKEVELGEVKIDAHINSLSDTELVDELNRYESSRGDLSKKE